MDRDEEKKTAARASVDYVRDGMIVGLGTGSTAEHAIRFLAGRVRDGLHIRAIASSIRSQQLAASLGISVHSLDEFPQLDLYIDGADEVDPQLNLIKGGGGALLREKIVASAAKRFVVIADSSKRVEVLGKFPLPVEVVAFAEALVARKVTALGATVRLRKDAEGNPYRTDEGHRILDCQFVEIVDPPALARILSDMPGVMEHGLFIGMAEVVLFGRGNEVVELRQG
jgi:ribose 5-phosphate isomerase A